MSEQNESHFKSKHIINLADAVAGKEIIVKESDLAFQIDNHVIQFDYHKAENPKKAPVTPGTYTFINSMSGANVAKFEIKSRNLLSGITNTKRITREANTFFKKLDVYEKLNRPKKRGVLLYSAPGLGKTSAISHFCLEMVNKDPGTVVINWPTDRIKSSDVMDFLAKDTEFTPECTKLILIIEDIGGGENESNGSRSVTSSLLNLLDGVGIVFKLPTFIVATTNHPENLLASLAQRPGRFDLMLELKPPSEQERVDLLKFIANRDITEEEETAIRSDKAKDFSIAHLEEVVIRSMLHDKTIGDVIQELYAHAEQFKAGFKDTANKKMGFGQVTPAIASYLDYEEFDD